MANIPQIRALQALSTFYVGEQAASPGCTYPFVAVRCVAHFLDMDAEILQRILEPLAASGFCELTRFEVRLTPSRWALNRSRYSSFLSFYVANAPFCLRGPYSQLPIDPKRGYNPQPQLEGQNTTIASNFNGVYSSSKYRENCEPSADQGPYELLPPVHGASQPELSAADNLNFLFAPGELLFRSFLCSMWLQGLTTSTAYGPVTFLLAEYPQQTSCLVAAPSDALCLQFQSPGALWSPLAFVAAVCPALLRVARRLPDELREPVWGHHRAQLQRNSRGDARRGAARDAGMLLPDLGPVPWGVLPCLPAALRPDGGDAAAGPPLSALEVHVWRNLVIAAIADEL